MNPWDTVTVTLNPDQVDLVRKFALAEERRIQRNISRLQNKVDALYSLKYAASDFVYLLESKMVNVPDSSY